MNCLCYFENRNRFVRIIYGVIKFLAVGFPAFLIAIPLNFFLVDHLAVPKSIAYAIVLIVQVHISFPLCRIFVFKPSKTKTLLRQYIEFMSAIALFRGLDWVVYSLCAKVLYFPLVICGKDCYYLVYQLMNVIIFALAKYFLCKRAIEGKTNK